MNIRMKTILHDLDEGTFSVLNCSSTDAMIFRADGRYAQCQGCFRCWLKHAGFCVMKDSLQHAGALIGKSDPLIIISKCCYGGYSAPIKTILDRAIGESIPFFTWNGGQTHHISRYPRRNNMHVFFYGECTPFEQQIAAELVERNRLNFNFETAQTQFFSGIEQLKGVVF